MPKIKLYIPEKDELGKFIRHKCRFCKETLYFHPDRWIVHLEKCLVGKTYEEILCYYYQEQNQVVKDALGKLLLYYHDSNIH